MRLVTILQAADGPARGQSGAAARDRPRAGCRRSARPGARRTAHRLARPIVMGTVRRNADQTARRKAGRTAHTPPDEQTAEPPAHMNRTRRGAGPPLARPIAMGTVRQNADQTARRRAGRTAHTPPDEQTAEPPAHMNRTRRGAGPPPARPIAMGTVRRNADQTARRRTGRTAPPAARYWTARRRATDRIACEQQGEAQGDTPAIDRQADRFNRRADHAARLDPTEPAPGSVAPTARSRRAAAGGRESRKNRPTQPDAEPGRRPPAMPDWRGTQP